MAEFKDMLLYFRKRNNWTQAELAKRLNVAPTTIASYEQGKRHPDFAIEEAIADLFNVSLNTLRGLSEELTDDEKTFLTMFRNLDKNARIRLSAYMQALNDMQGGKDG